MPGARRPLETVRPFWRSPIRWFYLAHLQSGLGAGAGYVALMLVAYERIGSAWAATAVLLADLLPSMLLGPLLGAIVDRTDRLRCAIAADVIRAAAMAGLVLADGTVALIALALVAGLGNALFRPATCALLPSLVPAERLSAANAAYDAVRSAGFLLGPACAGALLLVADPGAVLALNAATFALSGALLCLVRPAVTDQEPVHERPADDGAGLRTVLGDPVARSLILASGAAVLASGTMNVAEVALAQEDLRAGATGLAALFSAYGAGLIAGSLLCAGDTGMAGLRRRYLAGLALLAVGLLGSAIAGSLALALVTFAITGAGNGAFLVADRVLIQLRLSSRLHGRAFGLLDMVDAWGFGAALLAGGVLATVAGGRVVFAVAAAGTFAVLLIATRALRAIPSIDGRGVPMTHTTFTWPGDAAERTPLSPAR